MISVMLGKAFERIKRSLSRTRRSLGDRLGSVLGGRRKVDEELLEDLEEILLEADIGVATTMDILDALREERLGQEINGMNDLRTLISERLRSGLQQAPAPVDPPPGTPRITLLVGVNGSGKTTTAGKLALRATAGGERGILCAADTFRAAAAEQLSIWAERSGAHLVRHQDGSDPSAVVFDALAAAQARRADFVIVDTAGRLHTKTSLMAELGKIHRIAGNRVPGAPHEVLLVMDATTGQNGIQQARVFTEAAAVTGLVLTKIDGTARGGVALAINRDLGIPIRYLGVGEAAEDLVDFEPEAYLEGLFCP
ncbi:MAG: signal recognition particle-docking protein FtsY [Acidobacteria bacterium]|nr:MAG: signal recognition particle-docking protein FtsY [Acidobacteriota bacterium]